MLSRVIPVQFATFGLTYWIPCQVEPSIALIGMSLPAMRQLYFKLRGREMPGTNASASKPGMSGLSGGSNTKKSALASQDYGTQSGRFYQINDTNSSEIELRTGGVSKGSTSPAYAV